MIGGRHEMLVQAQLSEDQAQGLNQGSAYSQLEMGTF